MKHVFFKSWLPRRRPIGELFLWKSVLVMLITCLVTPSFAGRQQSPKFTIDFKNATLTEVFATLGEKGDLDFTYNTEAIRNSAVRINKSFKDASLAEVLQSCLQDTPYTFEQIGTNIIIRVRTQVKENLVKGRVTDEKGAPLPGVSVQLEGTTVGVATDVDGNFVMRLPVSKGSLIFSFVGYQKKKVSFTGDAPLSVKMQEEIAALDEVTVRAYGTQKKRVSTSAISSVKGSEIQELPTYSLESLLQGRMAGVEINNVSGSPGGGGSVVAIRGYNSLFSKGEGDDRDYGTPLYVVDGVPMEAFTSPVTGSNTLSDIDPSTIESVEVLKDAASAAIYGSRAGNGVILITTKKGHVGKGKFSANVSYSASWLPETPVQTGGHGERLFFLKMLQNARGAYLDPITGDWKMTESYKEVFNSTDKNGPFYDFFWGGRFESGKNRPLQDSLNPFYNNSTDWWRYVYRTAKVINANVQASGGSEGIQYMVGAGFYKEEGIVVGTDFQRFNLMANISAKPADRLKVDFRTSFSYSDRSRGDKSGSKIESVGADPARDGSLYPGDSYVKEQLMDVLSGTIEKNNSYSYRTSLMLDYTIMKGLNFSVSGSLNFNQQNLNSFKPSTKSLEGFSISEGAIGRTLSIQNEDILHYNRTWKEDHNFDVILGFSLMKNQKFNNSGSGEGGPSDYVHYVGKTGWGDINGVVNTGDNSYRTAFKYSSDLEEDILCSYFGRFSYNYKEKYLFEATLRRDGSSVFGMDVRWATFPSVAAGWAFSEEPWMKRFYWLSFGKIRASWGKSGQKFSQPYLAYGLFMPDQSNFLGQSGMMPYKKGGVINRRLSWEETDQYDIGLDIDLFNYRLKFVVDYYYRYTSGLLNQIDLPGDVNYFSMQWQNAMAVSNEGLELELQADILRESAVKLRMRVTASRNWNKFRKSSDGYDFKNYVIGKPLYQMRAYKTNGYYKSLDEVPYRYKSDGTKQLLYAGLEQGVFLPGMKKIVDLNDDGEINDDDLYYAASPLPKASGGIFFELSWKMFDLNVAFNYSIGRHIANRYGKSSLEPGRTDTQALLMDVSNLNSWKNAGSVDADYPNLQYYRDNYTQFSSVFDTDIENVHMLRLKQLTLGYNLDSRIAGKVGFTSARLFVTAENLFLLTNYSGLDPEIVDIYSGMDRLSSYPLPRKFTVGLSLKF